MTRYLGSIHLQRNGIRSDAILQRSGALFVEVAGGNVMEPLYFVMAIMGCGDAGSVCEQARVEPVRYRSALECQAAMPEALYRNSDLFYPELTAACQERGLRMAKVETAPRG